jgi:hypothetical protein
VSNLKELLDDREDTRLLHMRELSRMDPGERKRYLADMAAKNHRLAMSTGMNKSAAFEAGKVAGILTKIAETVGKRTPTAAEYELFRKRHGPKTGVSLAGDKDGFYVYTHRARSKSYSSPDKIPADRVKFIESTG